MRLCHWPTMFVIFYQSINQWPNNHQQSLASPISRFSSLPILLSNHQAGVCASCFTSSTFTGNPPVGHFVGNCPTTSEHCQVCWSALENFSKHWLQHGEHGGEAGPEEDRAACEERRVQPKAICCRHHED